MGIEKAGSASKLTPCIYWRRLAGGTPRSARINTTRVTDTLSTNAAAISRPIQQDNKRRVFRTSKRPKGVACDYNVEAE